MKRPQPDFGEIAVARYLENLGFISKFIKLWGTTTVNGEEVLVDRRYFYKNMDEDMVKLTKWLKIHNDLTNQKMKGIKSAWLYLNPAKEGVLDVDSLLLAENLEKAVGDGITVELYLQPKFNNFNRSNPSFTYPNIVANVLDQSAIIAEIESKFSTLYYGGYVCETNQVDRYKDAVAKYALIAGDVPYKILGVSKIADYISVPVDYATPVGSDIYSSTVFSTVQVYVYKVRVRLEKTDLTSTSPIVSSIVTDLAKGTPDQLVDVNLIDLKRRMGSTVSDGDGDPDWTDPGYSAATNYSALSSIWVVENGKYYLKTSFLRDNSILAKDRVAYLVSLIDSDYKKKPVSAWERFIAMVIIVAAVVFAAPSGGTSLTLVSAGTFILTVAFYVTVAAVVMQKLGYDNIALSLNDFLKVASPLIAVASIIAVIGALQNIASVGRERLLEQGTEAAQIGLRDAFIEGVKASFENLLTSATTDIGFEQVVKGLDTMFNAYSKQDSKDLQRKIKREEAKIAEYEEAMEQNRTNHMLLDAMRSSYNPLARDYSFYDSLYDKPYEWWATPYHTGCMQANGVSAFWTTDKNRGIIG